MATTPETIKRRIRKACETIGAKNASELPEDVSFWLIQSAVEEWALYYMNGALCFNKNSQYTPNKIISLIQRDLNGCGVPYSPQAIARKVARLLREQGGSDQKDKADLFTRPSWNTLLKNAEQNRIERAQKLSFGIEQLDLACGGVYGGNMLGIFGNPGSHKTMLLTNAITQWIKDGGSNIWLYELDMGADAIFNRLLAKELRCSPKTLRSLTGSKEYEIAQDQVKRFYGEHLHIMDRTNNEGERWTIEEIIEGVERFEPEIVAIDYLTCLELRGQSKPNEHELAKTVSKKLCDTAQRYGTLIITLSQMSQSSQQIQKNGGFGAMPMGGTDVWNDSDVMIELQNDTAIDEQGVPTSNIIATVRKSRTDGKIGSSFKLNTDFGRFTNNAEIAVLKNRKSKEGLFDTMPANYI